MSNLHTRFGRWLGLAVLAVAALGARPATAQVSGYAFNAFYNQPYSSITGTPFGFGAANGGGGDGDDGYSGQQPLGFAFPYNGSNYTSLYVNTNGWVGFGPGSQLPYNNALSYTTDNLLAFFAIDLNTTNATYSYVTTGTAPNRIFKLQAAIFNQFGRPTAIGNAQVWLYETTGQIEYHYGIFTTAFTIPIGASLTVGLRGTGTSDVRSVTGSWTQPVASTSATASLPLGPNDAPINGSVFRFAPAGDVTPPTIGRVSITPAGGACVATSHTVSILPSDASGIFSAVLSYSVAGGAVQTVPMTLGATAPTYSGVIPAQGFNPVTYFVTVSDASTARNTSTSASVTYADQPTSVNAGADQTINVGQTATLTATAATAGGIKITEFTLIRSGTGSPNPLPAYVSMSDDDFVEITNTNTQPFNLVGYKLEIRANSTTDSRAYTFPASAVLPAQGTVLLHIGSGTDSPADLFYHTGGSDNPFFSSSGMGLILYSPANDIIDAIAVNGFTLTGIPAADWSGTSIVNGGGVAGSSLRGADLNTSANWQASTTAAPQNLNVLNPGLTAAPLPSVTWSGGLFTGPVTANPATTPAHNTPGPYTYTASYTANGCTATDQVVVTVVVPSTPVANFIASATSVTQTDVVTFTDQSTNQPTNWNWVFTPGTVTFVNGTSATSQNPQVTFNNGGTYTVALTAANSAGSNTFTRRSYISVALAYCTTNLQTSSCAIGGGFIAAVVIPTTTLNKVTACDQLTSTGYTVWPTTGNTTASLTAGQTYTLSLTSSVSGTIVAWLDSNGNGTFEVTEFINVSQGGPANVAYSAQFTVPANASAGPVRLRVRNGTSINSINATQACVLRFTGETEDYTLTIVAGCPVPVPTITSNSPVCSGQPLDLAVTNAPQGTTVTWAGPNNYTATGTSVTVANPATGTYTATVTGNCTVSNTVSVTVNPTPSAPTAPNVSQCGPGAVTLTASGTPTGGSYRWYTVATQGQPISGQNGPSYTTPSLTTTTTYYVSAVSDASCEGPRTAVQAIINPVPAPTISAGGSTTFCAGGSVTLTAAGGGSATYQFLLNGQPISSTTPTTLEATADGVYTVTATASPNAGGCTGTSRNGVTVTVNPRPAALAAISAARCGTGTVTLAYTSLPNGVTPVWYANATGGQPLATGASFTTPSLTTSTTYYVSAVNTSTTCESTTRTAVQAVINPAITATLTASGNTTFCAGGSVTLTASGAGNGGTYQFLLNGQPVNGTTATTLVATASGSYSVTATSAGNCSGTSAAVSVTVNPIPSAAFAYSASSACASATSTIAATVTGATGGTFTVAPTGLTVNSSTGAITPSTSSVGTYTVTYSVSSNNCPATTSQSFTITAPPTAGFAYTTVGTLCAGATATLTPTLATGATAGSFAATPTGLTINPTTGAITVGSSAAGTYTVTNTVAAANGCAAASATTTVTLASPPTALLTAGTAPTTFCAGGSVTLTASGAGNGGTYQFLLNGQPVNGTTATTLVATASGSYSVTATSAGNCSGTSAAVGVTVNPIPSAAFAYSASSACASATGTIAATVTGATGGTFTVAPTGLTVNSSTGAITPATSSVGTYTVTYSVSSNNCPATASQSFTITAPPSAGFAYTTVGTLCAGATATLTPTLATGATAGSFAATPTGLAINPTTGAITVGSSAAGTYTVTNTVAAANGCAPASATTTVTLASPPTALLTAGTAPTTFCAGGSVTLTASGAGNGGTYQFLLNGQPVNGTTATTLVATASGSYSVTATSAGNCSGTSAAVSVTVNPIPSAAFAYGASSACASATSTIAATVTGATGGTFTVAPTGLTVNSSTGAITPSTSSVGTYTVTYSVSSNNCPATASQSFTITAPPSAGFAYTTVGTLCAGATATLTPTLATGATAGSFAATPTGLAINPTTGAITVGSSAAGTYTVTNTVAAANGCAPASATTTVTLASPPTALLTAGTAPTTFCAGGSVTLTASGAGNGGTYQFLLNGQPVNGTTATTLVATASGSYSVTATSAGNCSGTSADVSVTVNPVPSAAFAYTNSTICQTATGTVTPTISGATGGTFTVSPAGLTINATTGAITPSTSAVNTYTVTYNLTGTCPTTATQTVTVTSAPLAAFTYPTTGTLCAGATATLTPTLGTGASAGTFTAVPVGLTIDAATGTIDLALSAAGTYTVTNTIAASGSCVASSASASVTLLAAPTATLTAGGATALCTGGSVTLTASGAGNGSTYQFLLDGQPVNGTTATTLVASAAGSYAVTATNAAGCTTTSDPVSVTITPADVASFSYGAATYCLGGTNAPTANIVGAQGGTFSASPAGLTIDAATGALDLSASAAGTYTVTYATAGACPISVTQTVTLTSAPTADFAYTTTPGGSCAGSVGTLSATLTPGAVSGVFTASPTGLTIDGATGTIDLATSAAGTYTVTNTVAAAGSCAAVSATASVTLDAAPTAALTASSATAFCAGGSVTLTASGGTSYQFLLDGQPVNGTTATTLVTSAAGSYAVTATNAAGCTTTSDPVAVTITPADVASFSYGAATYCLGGTNAPTANIVGAQGGTFSASPAGLTIDAATGALDLSASAAGTYTVTYATAGACPISVTQTVTLTSAPTADFAYTTTPGGSCAGTSGTLSATLTPGAVSGVFTASPAGLTIDGATGTIDLATSAAGTYTVTNAVAAAGSCAAVSATASVTLDAAPTAALTASGATAFCAGGSVTLTASGGTSYQFLLDGQPVNGTTATTLVASAAGSYAVTATNAAGCTTTSDPVSVTITPADVASFSYGAATYCLGGTNAPTANIVGAQGGTFSASPAGLTIDAATGALDLSASAAGTYTVTYATAGACPISVTQTVTLTSAPTADFAYTTTPGGSCAGSVGTLSATLTPGAVSGVFTASPTGLTIDGATGTIDLATSAAGTYTVTNAVAAAGACAAATGTATVIIRALPTPSITHSGPLTFCAGDSVTLTAEGGGDSASYQFLLDGQPVASVDGILVATAGGSYTLTATNTDGCSATSAPLVVTVTPAALATFSYPAATFCLGSTAPVAATVTGTVGGTFSSTPTGLVIDATTGAIDVATSTAGTYTVTYSVGGACPAASTQTVTLSTAPTAAFTYPTTGAVCAGSTATLSATLATGAASGTFTATPAGLTIDAATGAIDVATSTAGTYTVTNDVAASGACAAASATATVTIDALPTATITAGGPLDFCAGGSVTLDAPTGTGLTYQWSTGAQTPSVTVTTSASVTVTVTNAAGCSATSAPTVVTVTSLATAGLTYPVSTYCQTTTVNLTPAVTGTPGGTFTATPAGLTLDPATGVLDLTVSQPGTYVVTYTTGTTCPASASQTLTVTAPGNAAFAYAIPVACTSGGTLLTPTAATGAALGTFSAIPVVGLTLNPQTGVIDPATSTPGQYFVLNTLAPAGGCGAVTVRDTVTIVAQPTAALTGLTPSVCANTPAQPLTGTVNGIPVTALNGTFTINGQPATSFDPTVLGPGTYTVVLTSTLGGCSGSATATVTVNALPATPTVTVTPQTDGTVLLTSSAAAGNQWLLNGAPINGATDPTYTVATVAMNGAYTVQVTDAATTCASLTSTPVTVTVTATAPDLTAGRDVQLYPNPTANGQTTVALTGYRSTALLTLFDAVGRRVLTLTVPTGTTTQALDLHTLPTGSYTLRITAEGHAPVLRRVARD